MTAALYKLQIKGREALRAPGCFDNNRPKLARVCEKRRSRRLRVARLCAGALMTRIINAERRAARAQRAQRPTMETS